MKRIYLSILFLLLSTFLFEMDAQERIDDEAIVAQHKRMVYARWGDWRPYPKYTFFGIQTRFSYASVWGWLAPSRNRTYKRGPDIRPLSYKGLETRRKVQVYFQEKQTKEIKNEADEINKNNKKDFAYWTPLTVDADPLWLLYYKRMLKPLKEFPNNPRSAADWGFYNPEVYQKLLANGSIDALKEKLEVLKDEYKIARTVSMPRGKRFLKYHETLLGWREFLSMIKQQNRTMQTSIYFAKLKQNSGNSSQHYKDDKEIVTSILTQHKYLKK